MTHFFDFYDLHRSTDDISDKYVQSQENKVCRFCCKSYPEVSFLTIPHIIPELFGRNRVVSNFECDDCNKRFQVFESDTSTMVQHYLALLNLKTKKGVPIFQSIKKRDEQSTILKSVNDERNLNFGTNLTDFQYDEEKKTLTVNFRTRKFSPYSIYKVFLKMGISLLTESEVKTNSHYLDFLNSDIPITNGMQSWSAYRYMLKTKYHKSPKVNLYKAKDTLIDDVAYPEYVLLVNFANVVFQFFLPVSEKNMNEHKPEHKLNLELFPAFILDDVSRLSLIDLYILDMQETEKGSITDTIVFHYDSKTRNVAV